MKRSLWFLLITPVLFLACQTPVTQGVSTVPSVGATGRGLYGSFDKNIVLLEGFHWTSATDCPVGTTYPNGWYGILSQNASRIAGDGVNMVWFPPVSDAGSTEGYLPRQLNVFTNSYGSQTAQTAAVTAVKNAKMVPIADIVVNHRVGTTDWADFTNPDWGATKTVNYTVTADDEWTGTKSMNGDTGATISSARDLDHKNPTVQNGIKTWLNLVKGLGYQGWRYDMVVGYGASYVGMYNDSTAPVFSVGEYWDYNAQNVVNWIDGTNSDSTKRSAAFDFPYRNNLYNAVVNGHWNWLGTGQTHSISGVVGLWAEKAVTFLENHDTEEARNGANAPAFPNGTATMEGYAVLLTHPGTPMVFWGDLMDSGSTQELAIKRLIAARQNYGIQDTSAIWVDTATDQGFYSAYITGTNGEIAVKVGPGSWQPSGTKWANPGTKILYSGTNYCVWGDQGKISGKTWP